MTLNGERPNPIYADTVRFSFWKLEHVGSSFHRWRTELSLILTRLGEVLSPLNSGMKAEAQSPPSQVLLFAQSQLPFLFEKSGPRGVHGACCGHV